MLSRSSLTGLLLAAVCLLTVRSSLADQCYGTADDAARAFVLATVKDPASSVPIFEPRYLGKFRARLQQLLDDRYAPDSKPFRERLFGEGYSMERLSALSDAEFMREYLAATQRLIDRPLLSKISVIDTRQDRFGDTTVKVRYDLTKAGRTSTQERKLTAISLSGCWRVEVPLEGWARLEEISKILKDSRSIPSPGKHQVSRVSLAVAPASAIPRDEFMQVSQRRKGSPPLWVSTTPIVTQADVVAASAAWDCDAGLGPEDPSVKIWFNERGAEALNSWTQQNMGAMLAISINNEVVTFAKVAGVFGKSVTACLSGEQIENADTIAGALQGAHD